MRLFWGSVVSVAAVGTNVLIAPNAWAAGTVVAALNAHTKSVEFYNADNPAKSWKPTRKWKPSVKNFGGGVDIKLRNGGPYGGQVVAVADGGSGHVGVYTYPGLVRKWQINAGTTKVANVHGVEFLPDGAVAIANTAEQGNPRDQGRLRLYSRAGGLVADIRLPGAHSVVYDPAGFLWSIGHRDLARFPYQAGRLGTPTLYRLPSAKPPGQPYVDPYGHDLSPVYGRPDRLWITANGGVTQFSKTAKVPCRVVMTKVRWPMIGNSGTGIRWCNDFPGAATINDGTGRPRADKTHRRFVKGIGNDPKTGRVLATWPSPAKGKPSWTTRYATFFGGSSWKPLYVTPDKKNTSYYRARWLVAAYR